MPDVDLFPLGDFVLQSGSTLWQAKLAYKTYGALNAERDNVVLIPTFYAGHHTDCELMFSPGRAIDPSTHFIYGFALIATNKNPSETEINTAMSGNICRCGCYQRITAAIKTAATGA